MNSLDFRKKGNVAAMQASDGGGRPKGGLLHRVLIGCLSLLLLVTMLAVLPGESAEADDGGSRSAISQDERTGLNWRVRSSFESYTGGGEVSEGASRENGIYHFPLEQFSYDPETKTTTASFRGTIHYSKWTGYYSECPGVSALDLTFRNPQVVISPEGSHLLMSAVSRQLGEGRCGEPLNLGEVKLADLDAAAVMPESSETKTSWEAIPASLAEGGTQAFAQFYPVGSPLDPVSMVLPGYSGGVSDDLEGTAPDVPVYEQGARFLPDHRNALTEMVYASEDGQRVYFVEKQSGQPRQITVLNAPNLTPSNSEPYVLPTSYANDDGLYDPVQDRFFVLVPRNGQNWLMSVSLREGRWVEKPIHRLPDDPGPQESVKLTGLGYDQRSQRLLAITGFGGPGSASPYRAHVIDQQGDSWSGVDTELPAVPGYEEFPWKQMDSRASDHLMAFMDPQHAVFTPAATGYSEDRLQTRELPPFVLTVDAERRVRVTPQDHLLFSDGQRTRTHDAVHRFSDGTAVLYTRRKRTDQGGPDDAIRTVRLEGDQLEVTGKLTYAEAGILLPGSVTEDEELGLVYLFDTTSATMRVLDSPAALSSPQAYAQGQVGAPVPMPDSVGQTPLDGKFTMAVGPGHQIYYPYRDNTAVHRQYGVASLTLRGITPAWVRKHETELVLDGATGKVSVQASGLPAPEITWQVRRPGQESQAVSEELISRKRSAGSAGRELVTSILEVPADAAEGTVYTAHAENSVGRSSDFSLVVQQAVEPSLRLTSGPSEGPSVEPVPTTPSSNAADGRNRPGSSASPSMSSSPAPSPAPSVSGTVSPEQPSPSASGTVGLEQPSPSVSGTVRPEQPLPSAASDEDSAGFGGPISSSPGVPEADETSQAPGWESRLASTGLSHFWWILFVSGTALVLGLCGVFAAQRRRQR